MPYAEIKSIHLINYEGILTRNEVEYHFLKIKKLQMIFPFRLNRYVNDLDPDVVVIHSLTYPWQVLWLFIQLRRKVKVFAIHHAEKPLRFPKSLIQKITDRFVQGYFFSSTDLGRMWTAKGQIRTPEKVHEIIEVSSFFYPTKQNDALSSLRNNYLWVGRLDSNKDPVTLVKAFSMFLQDEPNATLKIVYRGGDLRMELDKLLSMKKTLIDRITLTEDVDHDELLHWYNDAAFVISTSYYESSGAAVCEGMACGCVPILTNIPSFRTMTRHGKIGLLFDAGSVNALYHALHKSRTLNFAVERQNVLTQFRDNLSCEAISKKMLKVITEV